LQGKFDYLPLLMIFTAKDPFIRDLRRYLNKFRPGSSYMRLGGQTFGRRYVTDAFVISFPGIVR
jgi:hypothetical protein